MSAVFLNNAHPVTGDPLVRRALELATDRDTLIDKVALKNGVRSQSVVPQTSVDAVALPFVGYDPAAAAKLLDTGGWKRGADGMRSKNGLALAVDLAIPSGYAPSAAAANILHDDWGRIGVNVVIHPYATPQYFAIYSAGGILQTGKFDAALFSQSSGPVYANINGNWDCASFPPHGLNSIHYCNPKVDALNDRYVRDFDANARRAEAAALQRAINADTPAIITYERTFLSAADSRLDGYHPNSFSYWGDPLELDI
jgi:peptide/nickel transport system substrate-binding protein